MNPADYSDEILDTTFATFLYRPQLVGGEALFHKCQITIWQTPPQFTIREARDGLVNLRQKFLFKLSDSNLEKLRVAATANDNRIIALNSDKHRSNILYVSVLPEQNKEHTIKASAELEEINEKIKEMVGPLLKRQKELRKIISEARQGPKTVVINGKESLVW